MSFSTERHVFNLTLEYLEDGKLHGLAQDFLSETKDHSAYAAMQFIIRALDVPQIKKLFESKNYLRALFDCANDVPHF